MDWRVERQWGLWMKEGGLLCWIPEWNSVLFGITWQGFSLWTQPCPSLSSPPHPFHFALKIVFCFCIFWITKKFKRKKNCKVVKGYCVLCIQLYVRSALGREWTYAILTLHLSYWIVCRIPCFSVGDLPLKVGGTSVTSKNRKGISAANIVQSNICVHCLFSHFGLSS